MIGEAKVPSYYSRKTTDILHKYGPGPRVHFHMGLFDAGAAPNTTVAQRVLKDRLLVSQETAIQHADRAWNVAADRPAALL
ncbi:methyltransferase, partial [Streptomyces varsoviensis]